MEVILNYSEHNTYLIKTVANFCGKEDFLDVALICKNGKKLMSNKLVLSCVSPFMKLLFSEWKGKEDIMTVLLPDVDHNILRLILDFVFEGTMKLSYTELNEFKNVLKMLGIRFPGASVSELSIQHCPSNPPPPSEKLRKKTHLLDSNNDIERGSRSTSNKAGTNTMQNPNSDNDPLATVRKASEPDDDPLNVPDYYFVSSVSDGLNADSGQESSNTGISSMNLQAQSSNHLQLIPSSSGPQITESQASIANILKNSGSAIRKRTYHHLTSNSNNDSGTSRPDQSERKNPRKQIFTDLKDISADQKENETVSKSTHILRTKRKT